MWWLKYARWWLTKRIRCYFFGHRWIGMHDGFLGSYWECDRCGIQDTENYPL